MKNVELLKKWIKFASLDMANFEEDERLYSFTIKDSLPTSIEAPSYSNDIFIIIDLMSLGKGEVKRQRLETAMQLNAFGLETRGGVIGWDTANNRLIISYRIDSEYTDEIILDNIIANLTSVAEIIQPQLEMKEIQLKAEAFDQNFEKICLSCVDE